MELMGSHLTEIGEKEEKSAAGNSSAAPSGPITPASATDPETAKILSKPGVLEAFQDPKVQEVIQALRGDPARANQIVAQYTRDPEIARKLQLLLESGILGVQR